jgi:hypothetical protein
MVCLQDGYPECLLSEGGELAEPGTRGTRLEPHHRFGLRDAPASDAATAVPAREEGIGRLSWRSRHFRGLFPKGKTHACSTL